MASYVLFTSLESTSNEKIPFHKESYEMIQVKRVPSSSFFPAAWWNERQIEQWKARPVLSRAIRARRRCIVDKRLTSSFVRSERRAVRIVAISEEPFTGGEGFARALAARLGWRYVDSILLIEHVVARGGDRARLTAALELFSSRSRQCQAQILVLQSALAETVRAGNVVCYGIAADLLNLEANQVRRIAIVAPYRSRRQAVEERKKLYGAEARIFLNECDRAQRQWRMQLFGSRVGLPLGYDLAVNLDEMGLDAALAASREMIRERSSRSADDPTPMKNFVLVTSIRAGLAIHPATAHLDLDVEILNKGAVLLGTLRYSEELEVVRRVLLSIAPEAAIDLSHIRLTRANRRQRWSIAIPSEARSWRGLSRRIDTAPRLAWTLAGLSALVLAAFAGLWFPGHRSHQVNGHLLNIAGVITDSDCGLSHNLARQTADCVRSCVQTRGARYVLSNGVRIFTLADQQKGAALAGKRVVATGFLDAATGYLQLRSVQPVAQ